MSISVVAPIYINDCKQGVMTQKCLNLARDNTDLDFELIIVETCSDHFREEADVHIFEKERTTATKSINRGFKLCTGEYSVLLTNDAFVGVGWLESLLQCFHDKEDCGLSTLATTQLGHRKEEKIEEGIWFSVAMMRTGELFDEGYVNSWDDTDLIMRTYLSGKKMYRNFNTIVEHSPGQTHYKDPTHQNNFEKNRERFISKYKEHKHTRIYKILTDGIII